MRLNAPGPSKGILVNILALAVFAIGCNVAVPGGPEKVFVSEPGRFEVIFPGDPEFDSGSIGFDPEPIILHRYTVQTGRPTAKYSVHYFDLPGPVEAPAEVFDSMIVGGFEEIGAQELEKQDILFDGHPSRVIRAAKPDGSFMKVQFIQTGNRIYQLMVYFPSEGRTAEETSRSAGPLTDKFVNSFKLSPS